MWTLFRQRRCKIPKLSSAVLDFLFEPVWEKVRRREEEEEEKEAEKEEEEGSGVGDGEGGGAAGRGVRESGRAKRGVEG